MCAAEAHRPATILVENVPLLRRWVLYPAWRAALEALGYVVTEHVFDVADFGVPQNRTRMIVTARLGEALRLESPKLAHRPFGPFVDWTHDGDECRWAPIVSKPHGVARRVAKARARGLGERFLVHYSTDNAGRELSRPIGTVTTKIQWAAVRGDEIRMLTVAELRAAMGFSAGYVLPAKRTDAVRMLGNAIPPGFARALVEQAAA